MNPAWYCAGFLRFLDYAVRSSGFVETIVEAANACHNKLPVTPEMAQFICGVFDLWLEIERAWLASGFLDFLDELAGDGPQHALAAVSCRTGLPMSEELTCFTGGLYMFWLNTSAEWDQAAGGTFVFWLSRVYEACGAIGERPLWLGEVGFRLGLPSPTPPPQRGLRTSAVSAGAGRELQNLRSSRILWIVPPTTHLWISPTETDADWNGRYLKHFLGDCDEFPEGLNSFGTIWTF